MLTAEPLISPAIALPRFTMTISDHGVVPDYRTGAGVPYLYGGRYFDDYEQAMRVSRWVLGGDGLPTKAEEERRLEDLRRRRCAMNQPAQPDQPGEVA